MSLADTDPMVDQVARRIKLQAGAPTFGMVDMMLTMDCNHRCDYCFCHKKRDDYMPWEIARATVDFLLGQAPDPKHTREMLFFGGEPLLAFYMICQIVEYAQWIREKYELALGFSMTTNGTLLTEEVCRFFQRHGIRYLLSIDGDQETHDAHRRLQGGGSSYGLLFPERFRMAKSYQPWQGTRMTVRPDTVPKLAHNVKHLFELGINQFLIGPATGMTWTADDFAAYEEQIVELMGFDDEMKRQKAPFRMSLLEQDLGEPLGKQLNTWGCGAGKGRMAVDPSGNIYGCAKIIGIGNEDLLVEQRFGHVLQGITHPERRARLADSTTEHRPRCAQCELRADCSGGCPATNLAHNGTVYEPAPEECLLAACIKRIKVRLAERAAAGSR